MSMGMRESSFLLSLYTRPLWALCLFQSRESSSCVLRGARELTEEDRAELTLHRIDLPSCLPPLSGQS